MNADVALMNKFIRTLVKKIFHMSVQLGNNTVVPTILITSPLFAFLTAAKYVYFRKEGSIFCSRTLWSFHHSVATHRFASLYFFANFTQLGPALALALLCEYCGLNWSRTAMLARETWVAANSHFTMASTVAYLITANDVVVWIFSHQNWTAYSTFYFNVKCKF
jgi:hypothetical protein